MNFRCLFFFLMFSSTIVFGSESCDKILLESQQYIEHIVANAPEIIKHQDNENFYLNEERVYPSENNTYHLVTDSKNILIHDSLIFFDSIGPYLSVSIETLAKKLFKNVCYSCTFEWQGGFALRCPNCASKNIGNKPNW